MRIEKATVAHAPELLALQKVAFRSEAEIYGDYSIQPLTQTLADLLIEFQTRDIFITKREKQIVGSVRTRLEGGTCHVEKLIVHPVHRNRGIGSSLMAFVEGFHRAKRFELFTGHLSARNLSLYARLGYREFKRERISDRLEMVFLEKRAVGAGNNVIEGPAA